MPRFRHIAGQISQVPGTIIVCALAMTVACRQSPPGSPPPVPGTPATFVCAWTAANGEITTLESTDGMRWLHRRVHATTARRDVGPSVAHDGRLSWMLMWADGPELLFKTGIGGSTSATGMTWESQPNQGRLVVRPESSPALAFGAGRWVVAYRRPGDRVQLARSQTGSATNWEPPVDVQHTEGSPRPADTNRAPALAFGQVSGQPRFVLAYIRPGPSFEAVVSLSTDGVAWSRPVTVATSEKAPALTVRDGRIFLMLSQGVSGGFQNVVFDSTDGVAFRELDRDNLAPLNPAGPATAIGVCTFVMIEQWSGNPNGLLQHVGPASPCTNPNAIRFTPLVPLHEENSTRVEASAGPGVRPALAFGQSGSGVEVDTSIDTDCMPRSQPSAPARVLAPAPIEARFVGTVVGTTTDPRARGPFRREFRAGLLFSRSRCEVVITRFDPVCFLARNVPVVGDVCIEVSRTDNRDGRFFPVSGQLSIPVRLHFHYDTQFASDDDIELTLSTETAAGDFRGVRLNTSGGTAVTGAITVVGEGPFRNGFLNGRTGTFSVVGEIQEGPIQEPAVSCPVQCQQQRSSNDRFGHLLALSRFCGK
jgi:hypothetical protein